MYPIRGYTHAIHYVYFSFNKCVLCYMSNFHHNDHKVSMLTHHLVWATKYRHSVLTGNIYKRCCDILIQGCHSKDVRILNGIVSKGQVHMHVEYPPQMSVSMLVKKLTSRTSHHLQDEFPILRKRYLEQHF